MVLHLCHVMEVPLRERNHLLVAAGYAPGYSETPLDAPEMAAVRDAVRTVLQGHEPYPAFAVDKHWNIVDHNACGAIFFADVAPTLMEPPINALRVALHPDGLSRSIVNLAEWREHLLARLRAQVATTGDPALRELHDELVAYAPHDGGSPSLSPHETIVVPMVFRHGDEILRFFSTTTMFGTPLDVTIEELAIETFFAADPATAAALRSFAS